MKIHLESESQIRRKLKVTVGADLIKTHIDRAYSKIGKNAVLKGFRPGKAPRNILEKYYAGDASTETINSIIDETWPEALRLEKISPVSYPKIDVKSFDPAKELVYEAGFDVRPEIKDVKGYKGIKLAGGEIVVTNEEVEGRLKGYQEAGAKMVPIDPPRPLQDGDVVTFDYEALKDGKPFKGNRVENYMGLLGAGTLVADFEKEMRTMSVGETRKIKVTLPADFSDKDFASREMTYTVTLKDSKKRAVPDLDDEFAKDLGHENLNIFRDAVREEIRRIKEKNARSELHKQVVSELVKANEVEIPESMTEMELDGMYPRFVENLRKQGVSYRDTEELRIEFRKSNRDLAKLRLQAIILFEAIWTKEALAVTDEDRERKLDELAYLSGQQKIAVRQYYENDKSRLGHLDIMILEDKTLDFILAGAKITTDKTAKP